MQQGFQTSNEQSLFHKVYFARLFEVSPIFNFHGTYWVVLTVSHGFAFSYCLKMSQEILAFQGLAVPQSVEGHARP